MHDEIITSYYVEKYGVLIDLDLKINHGLLPWPFLHYGIWKLDCVDDKKKDLWT